MQTVEQQTPVRLERDWSRALTLIERRDLLRARAADAGHGAADSAPATFDPQELVRRHQYWANRPVHRTVEDLERRLALDGITLPEYAAISHGVPLPDDAGQRWPWAGHLDRVCRDWTALQALPSPGPRQEHPAMEAMITVVRPFSAGLLRDLEADLDGLRGDDPHGVLGDEGLARQLLGGFEQRLASISMSATVLELHVVRHEAGLAESQIVEAAALLRERLLGEGGPAFLEEYPVMARILAELSLQERRVAAELARRVRDDAVLLAEHFVREGDLGRLATVSESRGDSHGGGRSVRALGFSGGTQVLYKPRCLAVDVFLHGFFAWLNGKGITATQRPVLVVDRGDYGWTEIVEARPCESPGAVERFYRRQGGLLAVCHLLSAKDLHFENIIAEGEYPVAVDLEGFFQPPTPRSEEEFFTGGCLELTESGLLPRGMTEMEGQYADFDASGMAGSGGVLPVTTTRLSSPEEGLRVRKDQARLETQPNLPVVDGERIGPREHVAAVEAGFREVAQTVRASVEELTGPGGLLEGAAGMPIRIFHRPTNVYGRLLLSSVHSDLLRDALDRERLFDTLWAGDEAPPMYQAAFPHERRELLASDVPMFTARSDGLEVRTSRGEDMGVSVGRSGLAVSRARLEQLDTERIEDFVWALRAGLAATAKQGEDPRWPSLVSGPPRNERLPVDALQRRATELAGLLARRIERSPAGTTWAGLSTAGSDGWSFGPVDLGLYGGSSGIVLFLAYAGAQTGEQRFTQRAVEGLDTIRRGWDQRLEADPTGSSLPVRLLGGAFSELGGAIFALTHLSVLWGRDDLAREALALCEVAKGRLGDVGESDVIGGLAGTLAVALTLHQATLGGEALALATRCGELLAERAEPRAGGVAWRSGGGPDGGVHLAGFSHGAAGIATSLARLARASGEEGWGDLAARARRFEDSLFSEEHGNWRDMRGLATGEALDGDVFPLFWCHGAPGVALARSIMFDGHDDQVARDLQVAVRTTVRTPVHPTHCLCHGSLGNLLALRRCAGAAGEVVAGGLDALVPPVLDTIDRHGVVCGVPDGVPTPGFMVGTAGVGYALLALADPGLPALVGLDDLPT